MRRVAELTRRSAEVVRSFADLFPIGALSILFFQPSALPCASAPAMVEPEFCNSPGRCSLGLLAFRGHVTGTRAMSRATDRGATTRRKPATGINCSAQACAWPRSFPGLAIRSSSQGDLRSASSSWRLRARSAPAPRALSYGNGRSAGSFLDCLAMLVGLKRGRPCRVAPGSGDVLSAFSGLGVARRASTRQSWNCSIHNHRTRHT